MVDGAKAYPIFSRIRGWRRYQSMVASLDLEKRRLSLTGRVY